MHPVIRDAPGLTWKPRKGAWEARWAARTDLVRRGFTPKSVRLWAGTEPSDLERDWISDRCRRLQNEMLIWGRGGILEVVTFDGTIASLVHCYQTDQDSTYQTARYKTKEFYDALCRRLERDCGTDDVRDLDVRRIKRLYESWAAGGKITMGHACVGMLRTLLTYGATLQKDKTCLELKTLLHDVRFKMPTPRSERLTADQASAIRAKAWEIGKPSIALAQAFQFEAMLRQKDVIGEWVPSSEPGLSDVLSGNSKWLRGLRWQEIDENLILRHTTSKRQKDIEVDLNLAPMVLEELTKMGGRKHSGPVIICERTQEPWQPDKFRRYWRLCARACGIPDAVRSMDSRAGAITEATEAGSQLEHIKQAATHSDIGMTQRYARAQPEKTAIVMRQRAAYRKAKNVTGK